MEDVDHTHPNTNENFGDAFRRGPDVAADGGESADGPSTDAEVETNDQPTATATESGAEESATLETTMDDVDHTSTDAVDRTFERGTEGRTDSV